MIYAVRESTWWTTKTARTVSAGRTSARLVKERVGFFNKCADPEKYSKGGGGWRGILLFTGWDIPGLMFVILQCKLCKFEFFTEGHTC